MKKTCVYLDVGSIPASSIWRGDLPIGDFVKEIIRMKYRGVRRKINRKFKMKGRHWRKGCTGECSWCTGNRLYSARKRILIANEEVERAVRCEAEE